jgi:hypothetical protein
MEIPKFLLDHIAKKMTDDGKIVEAGWQGFKTTVLPYGADENQILVMRTTFFAGAQHLFASIMSILDAGQEPTDADMLRMDKIHQELKAFEQELLDQVST